MICGVCGLDCGFCGLWWRLWIVEGLGCGGVCDLFCGYGCGLIRSGS